MKDDELEAMLEGATETPRVDFKGSCAWDVKKFAKDILAMANLSEGGFLIIGVEAKGHARTGIQSEHKETYKIDVMKDQMSAYADPYVNFTVEVLEDRTRKEYVVIRVNEFTDIPVICKKGSADTKLATIYYRNTNRRVESAPISNSHDMRSLIELAAVKMMRRMKSRGLDVSNSNKTKFDKGLDVPDPDKAKFDGELNGL